MVDANACPRPQLWDPATRTFDPDQLRYAKVLRNLGTEDLARLAGVSVRTVEQACAGRPISERSIGKIRKALAETPIFEVAV